jgi:hypothetical protein
MSREIIETHYCDFCGVKTNEMKKLDTKLRYNQRFASLLITIFVNPEDYPRLSGDCCVACYKSYRRWVHSRK